jgi:Regulator of chromosome condensation (RCC1) repeat
VTCALSRAGAAYCWGAAMGDSAAYADRCLEDRPCSFAPVPLAAGRAFASLNPAYRCGVSTDGQAVCWANPQGSDAAAPGGFPGLALVAVDGEPGTDNACAVLRSGAVVCRGDGTFGLLGNGTRDSLSAPVPVASAERFGQVAVLGHWACALSRAGRAFCWGAAGYDDVHTADAPAGFEVCPRWGSRTRCNTRPVSVSGALRFRSLTRLPRDTAMLGIMADGRAYAWGGDRDPRPWHADQRWANVSAGDWGTCGVTTAGELFCWGRNPHDAVRGRIAHPAPGA